MSPLAGSGSDPQTAMGASSAPEGRRAAAGRGERPTGSWGPLRAALHAAARGWPVFPLRAGGKVPAIRAAHAPGSPCRGECGREGHGFHDATTDPDRITAWWRIWPRANYGIATGPAGLVVVDLDTGKGAPPARVLPDQDPGEPTPAWVRDGTGVLAWAAHRDHTTVPDKAALALADIDEGPGAGLAVRTPSGGLHLYFIAPDGGPIPSSVGSSAGRLTGRRCRSRMNRTRRSTISRSG